MNAVISIIFLVVAVFFYFLPAYIAKKREHPSHTAITIINLFFGWTLIGWVGALAWAYTAGTSKNGDAIKCPDCAELIKPDAKVCKHCGYRFPAD